MSSRNTIPCEQEDYLEIDDRIPGQNYVCMSFVSPEDTLVQAELFRFNKYMNQVCKELEDTVDEAVKTAGEEYNNKITKELKNKLQFHMKYEYNQFKDKFDDFKYKYSEELEKLVNEHSNFRTNVRGVKIRGVFDTHGEAERRAKMLQKRDRSFHVFVGQMGYWLPWDPCADKVQNEEYLEEELNTLMKEYKENEVRKDMFYEEQKREKTQAAMRERMEAEKKNKEQQEAMNTSVEVTDGEGASAEAPAPTVEGGATDSSGNPVQTNTTAEVGDNLQEEDPWLKSKFAEAPESETADAAAPPANPETKEI